MGASDVATRAILAALLSIGDHLHQLVSTGLVNCGKMNNSLKKHHFLKIFNPFQ